MYMTMRYGHFIFSVFFRRFLWAKMNNLSPIDFKIGLPINLNENDGQNKFEVGIFKKWPK